jgi:hypothetical protein
MKRLNMMVATAWTTMSLLTFALQPLQPVQAKESNASACEFASLQGSYDFVAPATITIAPGTVIAIPDELLYASPAPYASRGTLEFDGDGKVLLNATETFQGQLATAMSSIGDYTMNAGCAATVTFGNGTQLDLKMIGDGEVQTLVSTTPGFVIMRPPLTSGH